MAAMPGKPRLHARDPLASHLLKCLAFTQAHLDFRIWAVHIPGSQKGNANDISRGRVQSFHTHHTNASTWLTWLSKGLTSKGCSGSKTDQGRLGATVIFTSAGSDLCLVMALLGYLGHCGNALGHFLSIQNTSCHTFVEQVQQAFTAAVVSRAQFKRHSFHISLLWPGRPCKFRGLGCIPQEWQKGVKVKGQGSPWGVATP